MKKPHVHAAVIRAYADGAQVQYFNTTHGQWLDTGCPTFAPEMQYRIKPAKNQALIDAFDAGRVVQARLKSTETWRDQTRTKDLRDALESGLLDSSYDLRVKPASPEIYDAYMAGKTIQLRLTNRPDKWDDEPRGSYLERILLGTVDPVPNVEMRVKPDTYVQRSRRYIYSSVGGAERVGLAYKTDPTDERFIRWLDDDWLETELEG